MLARVGDVDTAAWEAQAMEGERTLPPLTIWLPKDNTRCWLWRLAALAGLPLRRARCGGPCHSLPKKVLPAPTPFLWFEDIAGGDLARRCAPTGEGSRGRSTPGYMPQRQFSPRVKPSRLGGNEGAR